MWSLLVQYQEIKRRQWSNPSLSLHKEIEVKDNQPLFLFLTMVRMKNKNLVNLWARIMTLSDNVCGSSKAYMSNHSYFGICTSMDDVTR